MNVRVLIGVQSAKGAIATSFTQLFATDYNVSSDVTTKNSEALTGSRFFSGASFASRINVSGSIPIELSPSTLTFLMENGGFGNKTTTAEKDVYKASEKVDKWLTIVCDYPGENCYEVVKDVKINQINIDLATESFVTGTMDIIGCEMDFIDTAKFSGTVVPSTDEQLICLNSIVKVGESDVTASLSNLSLSINNNLEASASINSVYNVDIKESTAEITADVTYNKFDKAVYKKGLTDLLAQNRTSIEITLGKISGGEDIIVKLPRCAISDNTPSDLAGFGSMSQSYNVLFDTTEQTPIIMEVLK